MLDLFILKQSFFSFENGPFLGFNFPFSWYIVWLPLANFTMLSNDRYQGRRRNRCTVLLHVICKSPSTSLNRLTPILKWNKTFEPGLLGQLFLLGYNHSWLFKRSYFPYRFWTITWTWSWSAPTCRWCRSTRWQRTSRPCWSPPLKLFAPVRGSWFIQLRPQF